MFSTIPPKPKNETDTMEAAMRVIGSPRRLLGISQDSILLLTPANIIIASIKPTPPPTELNIDARKRNDASELALWTFKSTTPRTAQFVVISGR